MTGKTPKKNARPGVDEYGRTPLHYAARDGDTEQIRSLLSAGINPNIQDDNGWSALHFAAQAASAEATKTLLSAGAAVDLKDSYGNTALWRATMNARGNATVLQILVAAGADPTIANNSGVSPKSLASTMGANYF